MAATLVFAFIALLLATYHGRNVLTGLQVIELPEPPSPPGMDENQTTVVQTNVTVPEVHLPNRTSDAENILSNVSGGDTVAARLDAIEKKLKALNLLPAWENRLNNVEAQIAISSNFGERVDALDSRMGALEVEVGNLKQRPFVDQPTFVNNLALTSRKITQNTILSIALSVAVFLVIIAMIISQIVERRKEFLADKKLLRQYLMNYQKAGYRLDSLRMHLKASGWNDWFIDEVLKELPK